ncbi:MAG TPA: UDP-N-acetylmuramate dehydrogenase [bacterium]|nr:UDP-N-acetylmuramate dehydrogenase [bacterium]
MTTDTAGVADALRELCRDVRQDEPLRRHVSFRIGGPADVLVAPRTMEELRDVALHLFRQRIPFTVLGAGSNVLVSDLGIRGVVLKIGKGVDRIRIDGETVVAESGAGLPALAKLSAARGLAGLEFSAGIPASVGGAVVMNAGAHGHAMAEVVRAARIITPDGEQVLPAEALGFAYRTSALPAVNCVVLEATLQLTRSDPAQVRGRTEEWLRQRGETQPLGPPSSGCVFRNPPGDHAGRLVDLAGGKGLAVGGARVSDLHANYILNIGRATAADVAALMDKVSALVMEKFRLRLEPEIKFLGEFPAHTER